MDGMTYGMRQRVIRTVREQTQQELAREIGASNSLVSNIETGIVMPEADLDAAIRTALRWTPEVDAALDALAVAAAAVVAQELEA